MIKTEKEKVILHSDLNNCYASIECLHRPELRDKPIVVGGDVEQRHGIVLAKNQIAKKHQIKTGEALWQAKQKCPKLVVVPPNFPLYLRFSQMARDIYAQYTDQIEPFGIDECWLDVTGSQMLFGTGEQIAQKIRHQIKTELGVTVSIGVSWNKIFAKLGSDIKKPDAVTIITKDNFKDKVWSLPANDLLYVGSSTYKKLGNYCIKTIGDIANAKPEFLKQILGKWGEVLYLFANGLDNNPVSKTNNLSVIKSIGNSTTTPRDLENDEDVKIVIYVLAESVAMRMREQGFKCTTVAISVRDTELHSFERQCKTKSPTNITSEIADTVFGLFQDNYNWDYNLPIRRIGVRATDFVGDNIDIQLDLFSNENVRIKKEQVEHVIDKVRNRYGYDAVKRAVIMQDKIFSGMNPKDTHTIHPLSYF